MPKLDLVGRRVYSTSEHQELSVPITDILQGDTLDVYPEVTSKGYFQIRHEGVRLRFLAGGKVGLIPINDRLSIEVNPRVPTRNLERLLQVAGIAPFGLKQHRRTYGSHADPAPSLVGLFANSILEEVQVIAASGLYREYSERIEETSFPRGRLLVGSSMTKSWANYERHKVTAAWYERKVDVGPNQCIKYALRAVAGRLLNSSGIDRQRSLLRELNIAYHSFDGVSLDQSLSFLQHPFVLNPSQLPPHRLYYYRALQIASAILRNRGVAFGGHADEILMSSMIIDMAEVFETYLRTVLQSGARGNPLTRILDGNRAGKKPLLSGPHSMVASPDVVILRDDGSCVGLVEFKYKPLKRPERTDLNQAITYATSYSAPHVVVAHPTESGSAPGLSFLGACGDVAVYDYAFDLDAENLGNEESAYCEALLDLVNA